MARIVLRGGAGANSNPPGRQNMSALKFFLDENGLPEEIMSVLTYA
jgi:hypothetical protein